jgi:glycosyltransferase involved in cell wall biosynthesis
VIIATFNRGAQIGRTLDSVLAQTLTPAEVVVVDDGSTDNTAAWIQGRYEHVIVRTFPNAGTSAARNRGAEIARGDLLMFLDHDDELHPHAIETLAALLTEFSDARAAFADHALMNLADHEYYPNHHAAIESFQRMKQIPAISQRGDQRLYGRDMYYALLRGNILQQPWAIYRSDFLALGGFDENIRYCEDWELYLRVAKNRFTAVSDCVIASHFIEGQNLHRAAGQEAQHITVLKKHIRLNRFTDLRTVWILRQRLALYYKAIGDRRRAIGSPEAWNWYVRALGCWPFDSVVCARCLLWLPDAIHRSGTGSGQEP